MLETEIRISYKLHSKFIFDKFLLDIFDLVKNKHYTLYKSISLIELSTNTDKKNVNYVKEIYLLDNDKKEIKIYTKKNLSNEFKILNSKQFKISTSEEIILKDYVPQNFNLIRSKFRISYLLNNNWRCDITLTKQSNTYNISYLKALKEDLLSFDVNDLWNKNLTTLCAKFNSIEVEFEFMGVNFDIACTKEHLSNMFNMIENIQTEYDIQQKYLKLLNKKLHIGGGDHNIKNKNVDFTIKNTLPNPVELTRKIFKNTLWGNTDKHLITDKLDGIRSLLIFIESENKDSYKFYYFNNNELIQFHNMPSDINTIYVFDCEYHKESRSFYIFDLYLYAGAHNKDLSLEARLNLIKKFIETLDEKMIENNNPDNPSKFYIKDFKEFTKENINTLINGSPLYQGKYKTDGLIITSNDNKYESYKFKPSATKTIDFLAKLCPRETMGLYPYMEKSDKNLYILFNGITTNRYKKLNLHTINFYNKMFFKKIGAEKRAYFPIQFEPSEFPHAHIFYLDKTININNKIVELRWDLNKEEWDLINIREDRDADLNNNNYYGNDYRVAELIFNSYYNMLNLADLYNFNNDGYFKDTPEDNYTNLRKFNNFVKQSVLNTYNQPIYIAWDLCSGKGQDLWKYASNRIQNIVFSDIDKDNISEIIDRKYTFANKSDNQQQLRIYAKRVDLTQDLLSINNTFMQCGIPLKAGKCELIICNFGIHYLCYSKERMEQFAELIDYYLAPTGRLLITGMDGELIFKYLKDNNWKFDNPDYPYLYFESNEMIKFSGESQIINIKLPFKKELYPEAIVNFQMLKKVLSKKKIKIEMENTFSYFIDEYEKDSKYENYKLNSWEKKYIGFHQVYVFYKKA